MTAKCSQTEESNGEKSTEESNVENCSPNEASIDKSYLAEELIEKSSHTEELLEKSISSEKSSVSPNTIQSSEFESELKSNIDNSAPRPSGEDPKINNKDHSNDQEETTVVSGALTDKMEVLKSSCVATPSPVPRRSKVSSNHPEHRDSYHETKVEIEESLSFIKSKLNMSAPIPPSNTPIPPSSAPVPPAKSKRMSTALQVENKSAESAAEATNILDNPDYEPIQSEEPLYEVIPLHNETNSKMDYPVKAVEKGKEYSADS